MKKNIYAVILIVVILGSLLQFGSLARGVSFLAQETQANEPVLESINAPQMGNGFKPIRITAEKIGLDLAVTSVALKNGTWQVNPGVANFAEGTSLVNDKEGNVGIFAHDNEQGFSKIKGLAAGDLILISGDHDKATYKVSKLAIANPIEVDVYYATKLPQLTLVTCDGLFSEKRFVLTADLVKIESI